MLALSVQRFGRLALALFLVSCAPPEAVKEAKSAPPPPAPPGRGAQVLPSTLEPAPIGTPGPERRDTGLEGNVFLEWASEVQKACGRTRSLDAYLPAREGASAEDVEIVKQRCAESVEVAWRGEAWRKSLHACADRYMLANGAGTHACRLVPADVPAVPASVFDRHLAECSAACLRLGPEEIERKKERASPALCCDGTRSSCTVGALHQGCCAGHGGVCIVD
jgi:hypothetical protein